MNHINIYSMVCYRINKGGAADELLMRGGPK